MKKIILCTLVFLVAFSVKTYASENEINEFEIPTEILSNETAEILDEFGIDDAGNLDGFSFENVFLSVSKMIKNSVTLPLKLFGALVAMAILTSLYELFSKENSSFSALGGMLCASAILTSGIVNKISEVTEMLNGGCDFISSFVPVLATVTALGGNPVTATAYNLLMIFASNFAVLVSTGTVTSLCGCYLSLSLASSFGTTVNLNGLSNAIKKVIIWGLGIISTAFVGIISIQGLTGKAADSVALKTAKFTLNSTIPIVGSALSDALISVEGSIGVLHTTIGTFGIIAGLAIILPTLINIVLTKFSIDLAAVFAEMIGADKLSNLYKSVASVMTILIALILFFFLVLLVATTAVMLICS